MIRPHLHRFQAYRQRSVLITGGLGFLGSNLAIRLAGLGARVHVVDALVPGCGGDMEHLAGCKGQVDITIADIRDAARFRHALESADVIFNLAADISHTGSMRDPLRDLDLNVAAQLAFLRACCDLRRAVRVVYTSTRQVYGRTRGTPVDETWPVAPVDFNGVHKYTTTHYHLLLGRLGHIDPVVLRLTNLYGPRMALGAGAPSVLAAFFRQALDGRALRLFGDGNQKRDPLHVDDAVEALLLSGLVETPAHRVLNIGSATPVSLRRIALELSRIAGLPAPVFEPFPPDHQAIDIGDFCTQPARAAAVLHWSARIGLSEGLASTWDHYQAKPAEVRQPLFQPAFGESGQG